MAQSAIVAAGRQRRALASRSDIVAVEFFLEAAGGSQLVGWGLVCWRLIWVAGVCWVRAR